FGATALSAGEMFREAVVWNLLGTLVWIWVVPLVEWRALPQIKEKATLLAMVSLPAFLFSAFVHIGDPDQALASISILCTAGGIILAAAVDRLGHRQTLVVALSVMAVQSLIFFRPPGKIARAASYKSVAAVDRMTTRAITDIRTLRNSGPATIVHYGSSIASR